MVIFMYKVELRMTLLGLNKDRNKGLSHIYILLEDLEVIETIGCARVCKSMDKPHKRETDDLCRLAKRLQLR